MHRPLAASLLLAVVLAMSAAATAVPISRVSSAVGAAAPRNAVDPAEWMPQLTANLVFRDVLYARVARSLESIDLPALFVRVTELRPGETRLVFVDARRYVNTRASFITEGP